MKKQKIIMEKCSYSGVANFFFACIKYERQKKTDERTNEQTKNKERKRERERAEVTRVEVVGYALTGVE